MHLMRLRVLPKMVLASPASVFVLISVGSGLGVLLAVPAEVVVVALLEGGREGGMGE